VSLATIATEELPDEAIVGRFGGDELVIIGPPKCAHQIRPAVDRIRERLGRLELRSAGGEQVPLTVSVGISSYPEHAGAVTELLSATTVTLGRAKASGGDAVELDAPDVSPAAGQRSFDVLQGLVLAIDTKDRYTKRHSEDVARYAILLGQSLALDDEACRALHLAGLLHDVGKIGIPDDLLRKPAMLTAEERRIVEQHVVIGDLIVRDLPSLELVRAGVRYHHERWDGTGYPDGLAGDEIPRIARVIAVADAYSAMTTTRAYRKALDSAEAIRRLEDAAGTQLDPGLVRLFVGLPEIHVDPVRSTGEEGLWRPLEGAA
jgi:HD-GYP domain-containing protein (c-di-GMP phosphodiesterase class II)